MSNEYGLDVHYFKEKLSLIVRDASRYTPKEMQTELERLAVVAEDQIPAKDKLDFRVRLENIHSYGNWSGVVGCFGYQSLNYVVIFIDKYHVEINYYKEEGKTVYSHLYRMDLLKIGKFHF